jgi:hypothetical protein
MEFTGISGTMAELRAEVARLEKEAVEELKRITKTLVEELFKNTPVWSGETVRNYAVGAGQRPSGGKRGAIGSGPPGRTNKDRMPLGTEPRRSENESAARSEVNSALTFNKLVSIHVTNRIDASKWDLVDNGSAPTRETARYPGGVSMRAEQTTRGKHKDNLE